MNRYLLIIRDFAIGFAMCALLALVILVFGDVFYKLQPYAKEGIAGILLLASPFVGIWLAYYEDKERQL